eukprot:RCo019795
MSASRGPPKRVLIWFRNDLRLHDNPVLTAATRRLSQTHGEHVCVYCFDPRQFVNTSYGSKKTGAYRAQFLLESVQNLKRSLQALGSDLIVALEKPEEFLFKVVTPESEVFVHGEVTWEELVVERNVEESLRPSSSKLIRVFGGNMLYHVEDLPFSSSLQDLPNIFTPFKEKVERFCGVRDLLATVSASELTCNVCEHHLISEVRTMVRMPSLADLGFDTASSLKATSELDPRGVMKFVGGESAALQRVQSWMFEEDMLKDYFELRNAMLGSQTSSKLSPALAHGCISARMIFHEVRRYELTRGISNKSTYWLIFELMWRDFFRCLCAKYGRRMFFSGGPSGKPKVWKGNAELVQRWKEGRTGWPLVDANMRELLATGWMSNRGRQNVASFLVLDCGVDWRIGADHFESLLLDYDVCSNYGNWAAAAGLTGGRVNHFNISKQSRDYDPDGTYVRHWLPELSRVPAPMVFEPWKISEPERFGLKIGNGVDCTYPAPVKLMGLNTADPVLPYQPRGFSSSSSMGYERESFPQRGRGASVVDRGRASGGRGARRRLQHF